MGLSEATPFIGGNPLPWVSRACISPNGSSYWIEDARGNLVVSCNSEANARLIATAVNSYEKLVDALKYAKEIMEDQAKRFHQDCRCQLCESLPMVIEDALKFAEGE